MKLIRTNEKSVIFIDMSLYSTKEIFSFACHKREIVGNVAVLTTYRTKPLIK